MAPTSELEANESTPTLERLRAVAKRLASVERQRKRLMAERLALYIEAKDDGSSWRAISRAAGVTDVGVMRAIERAGPKEPAAS